MELSRVEHILKYFLGEEATLPQPLSRVEELLIALGELIEEGKVTNPISIRGRVDTVGDLPSDAEPGWLYFVGLATDTEFTEYIYLDSGRWEYLGSSMIAIDTTLSTTSTNPVQNSTITIELNKKPGEITTGKQYTIDGQTVTAGPGAEAFNDLVNNKAAGQYSHAEGYGTIASGSNSHAECSGATASGSSSHAEGVNTTASGPVSHAEGNNTIASGPVSHAEGTDTIASGYCSHSEGDHTKASSASQHVQGKFNVEDANDNYAFIIGNGTANNARHNAFAIDWNGLIYINGASTGVDLTKKPGEITTGKQYTIDGRTVTAGPGAEAFNSAGSIACGPYSHAEGGGTTAYGSNSHAEGGGTRASGAQSHSEGSGTKASSSQSHAEGQSTTASGDNSHSEGSNTTASGAQSHSEGSGTTASANSSHAEGGGTTASGAFSHAEGGGVTASGAQSHAEGAGTTAYGQNSHAEGSGTTASANNSHAEGSSTKASSDNQHVQGKFNVEDTNDTYAFIIGNGTADNARHNAFAIDWNGLIYVNGSATGVDISAFPSPSDINTAITKANAAAPQSTTYTKTETDSLLDTKADLIDGKVPVSQLPSYVDDVLEYSSTSAFPATGESGKIYVAIDTNRTYRWGGSAYAEISESLALGETSSTAYAGNKGKANADAIASIKDGTTIDSFADVESALSGKANTASLAAVATSGSYNDLTNKPTIPAAQVNADWNAVSGVAQILNKPSIPAAVTVDQVYDGTSANPQSGVAINSVIGNINTVLEEVL